MRNTLQLVVALSIVLLCGAPISAQEEEPKLLIEVSRNKVPIKDASTNRHLEFFRPTFVAFSPDGKEFAGADSQALGCFQISGNFRWGADQRAYRARFTADGKRVLFAGDGFVYAFDRASGKSLARVQLGHDPKTPMPFKGVSVDDLILLSSDGKLAYAATQAWETRDPGGKLKYSDFAIRVYETKLGKEVRRFPSKHSSAISLMALSPNGKWLVSVSDDSIARLWDAASGKELRVLKGHEAKINGLAWSSDGSKVVTVAGEYDQAEYKRLMAQKMPTTTAYRDGTVRIWTTNDGIEWKRLAVGEMGYAHWVAIAPDLQRIALTHGIWNVETGKREFVFPRKNDEVPQMIGISPDWRTIIASHHGTLMTFRIPDASRDE